MSKRRRKYGWSWSWRRAVGLSALKGQVSRKTGIPLTRSGRQRKLGKSIGCCVPVALMLGACGAVLVAAP